jgi:hypothetical protein
LDYLVFPLDSNSKRTKFGSADSGFGSTTQYLPLKTAQPRRLFRVSSGKLSQHLLPSKMIVRKIRVQIIPVTENSAIFVLIECIVPIIACVVVVW